jgi:hypothetical protein
MGGMDWAHMRQENDSMNLEKPGANTVCVAVALLLLSPLTRAQGVRDQVNGNLIQFNDNGAYCWFQDERAVVDAPGGKLIVGSVASGSGVGGPSRDGYVDAVVFDLLGGFAERYPLAHFSCDDHNAPGILIRPDGEYLAMYCQHYDYYNSRYRIFNGRTWSPEQRFDWTTIPGGTDYTIAYSNVYYLSAENRVYNFARANHRCPNILISTDMGDTWSYGGILATNTSNTYNKGYYRYWGNGVDRIDFIFTEQHPRDTTTSLYHGYIKDGKSYRSDGTVVDANVLDTLAIPSFGDFTKVFGDNTVLGGYLMRRCWNTDVMRYDDGTIVTIATARTSDYDGPDQSINPEHAFVYCRYNGSSWSCAYLAKAGPKLYSSEADYTGTAAVDPIDPNTVYISTTWDPRDSTVNLGVHEIFKGVTTDDGVEWGWIPITEHSTRDNIRPIVPAWDANNTALLWWRGTYNAAQSFDAAVVGILDRRLETWSKMIYTDATAENTTFASGAPLATTGPDENAGPADGQWHLRTNHGNEGSVLASSEIGGEDAPMLKTHVIFSEGGTYDLWVNFWADPSADWRIQAGLSPNRLQIYRAMASKGVESGDHEPAITLVDGTDTFLYQAYIGRVSVAAGDTTEVYVDDDAVQTGTSGTLVGNTARTWYDGVSFAEVRSGPAGVTAGALPQPNEFVLSQNYPNPFNPTTVISYQLPVISEVKLVVYDILGREVQVLASGKKAPGRYQAHFDASRLASGVYICRLTSGKFTEARKMMLIR